MPEQVRNEIGQFQENPDSLYSKSIGLRLSKRDYPKFVELAKSKKVSLAELAREAVAKYIKDNSENS